MKYPFTPELLDGLPEELAELYRSLEIQLLEEICSRLNIAENLNEVTVQNIRALRAMGIDLEEIKKAIAETSKVGMEKLDKLFDEVVERNQKYYSDLVDLTGVTAPERYVNSSDIEAIRRQTKEEFVNLTQSMGFLVNEGGKTVKKAPAKVYQWALDNAEMQVMSGGISYREAIKNATRNLADSGIKFVDYASGHVDHVDVAVRRAVMTGVNQVCQKYSEQSVDYLETDLVEVSAHQGARDTGTGPENHKQWQGKVYRWKEKKGNSTGNYPDFILTTGYGTGAGLGGWNCRHHFYPFYEGVSERTYTDKQLNNIDPPPVEYQGKTYTAYEATQKQRMIERTVRKLTRRRAAYESAGLSEDAQDTSARIRRLNSMYKEFSKAAGLPLQKDRTRVAYTDDNSLLKAAETKAKRTKTIAKEWNVPESYVTIEQNGTTRIKVFENQLSNGLPIFARKNCIVDKMTENGLVLQRRIYGGNGKAVVDFDTTDHNRPDIHPTGAHKHVFNYRKKNPHGAPQPLTETELEENRDIIKRGENYHDQK